MINFYIQNHGGHSLSEAWIRKTPKSAKNFWKYVNPFLYGIIFHRRNQLFHGFQAWFLEKPGYDAKRRNRTAIETKRDNGLKNGNCTLAMARTMTHISASCTIYINMRPTAFLNSTVAKRQIGWGYADLVK